MLKHLTKNQTHTHTEKKLLKVTLALQKEKKTTLFIHIKQEQSLVITINGKLFWYYAMCPMYEGVAELVEWKYFID